MALLLRSLARLGDSAGVYGFSGSGRHDVRVLTVKDFREPLSIRTFERLAGLTPIHMTRLAPVIRHVTRKLTAEAAETRLLLVVSDGRPFDLDYGDGYPGRAIEYANLDTQAAVEEALAQGIEPFVLTVDAAGNEYLGEVFERGGGYEVVAGIDDLRGALVRAYARVRAGATRARGTRRAPAACGLRARGGKDHAGPRAGAAAAADRERTSAMTTDVTTPATGPAGAESPADAADLLARPPLLPGLTPETVVFITGGSGAIGLRTAAVLSRIGARVAIMARSPERVAQAAADAAHEGQVLGVAGDIGVPDDISRAVTATVGTFGRLDALVNLAAVGDSGGALDDLTVDEIDTVLRTNLRGALLLAQECARPMRARGGSIINVASIGGHRVTPGRLVYGPSKAALIYLTRQLAAELGPYGIRANSISPGQTPTALRKFSDPAGGDNVPSAGRPDRPTKTGRIPLGRRGTLDDYVGAILFLISGLSAYVTGTDLLVDGGAAILR